MGSDEQYDLPSFPIVLAYNRINHYAPTAYLSQTSLSDWRLAKVYRHLLCAGDLYGECHMSLKDPKLAEELQILRVQLNCKPKVQRVQLNCKPKELCMLHHLCQPASLVLFQKGVIN